MESLDITSRSPPKKNCLAKFIRLPQQSIPRKAFSLSLYYSSDSKEEALE